MKRYRGYDIGIFLRNRQPLTKHQEAPDAHSSRSRAPAHQEELTGVAAAAIQSLHHREGATRAVRQTSRSHKHGPPSPDQHTQPHQTRPSKSASRSSKSRWPWSTVVTAGWPAPQQSPGRHPQKALTLTEVTRERPSAPGVPDVSPPRRSRMYSSDREWAALTASVTAELTASAPSSNSSGAMVTEMGVCWPVSTTFTIPSRAVASISVCTQHTREKPKGAATQTVQRERQWVGR